MYVFFSFDATIWVNKDVYIITCMHFIGIRLMAHRKISINTKHTMTDKENKQI